MQSTINLASYAIAGAIAFALVGGIGFFLMSNVIKNLRAKPLEQDELAEEEGPKKAPQIVAKEQKVEKQPAKVKTVPPSPQVKQEPVRKYKELILTKVADASVVESFSLKLEDRLTVGRTKEKNDWAMPEDHTISSKHCQLYIQDESVYLMDLNSTNGTYVNGRRIQTPTKLKSGDTIKLGIAEYKIFIR